MVMEAHEATPLIDQAHQPPELYDKGLVGFINGVNPPFFGRAVVLRWLLAGG